jgi:hypothetical protein
MDDTPVTDRDSTDSRPAKQRSLARVQALPWLLFIVALAIAIYLGYRAIFPPQQGDPLGATLAAIEKQNRLTVFSAQLVPVVTASDSRLMGLVQSKQVAVIPARVDYTLDLSKVGRNRLSWDEEAKRLTVQLPGVEVGKPNLDEARAQYLREGIWISRDAQDKLSRANTRVAESEALKQATSPVLMALARSAAEEAMRQNIAIPLEVAGFDDVEVEVRFDGEKTSG